LVFREARDQWGTARCLSDLGAIDCERGDHSAARAAYREALQIFAGLGHRRGTARALEGTACLALAEGQPARSLKLAAAAAHLRQLVSAPLTPAEQEMLDHTLSPAWQALDDIQGKSAWAEGFAMTLEKAVQYSLEESASSS
jgi:hypothetical protein